MSYEPKVWECDELITDDALNHIEGGIGTLSTALETLISNSGMFIIEATGTAPNFTSDKTYDELLQAIEDNRPCYIRWDASQGMGQQIRLYALVQYTRSGTGRASIFTHAAKISGNLAVETMMMSEDGSIRIV